MDHILWSFLFGSPDRAVPYPWERFYDPRAELLFYINRENATVVIDMRNEVNLGGDLYYTTSSVWRERLNNGSSYSQYYYYYTLFAPFLIDSNYQLRDCLFLIFAACFGTPVYLLVQNMIFRCPFCGEPVYFMF